MNAILVPVLYGVSGICAYAALHHGLIAQRRPVQRSHLLFALLCLMVALYVIAKAGAYRADSAQALVALRRWEVSFGLSFFAIFPWFVADYTGVRPRGLLAILSVFFMSIFVANVVLPYGVHSSSSFRDSNPSRCPGASRWRNFRIVVSSGTVSSMSSMSAKRRMKRLRDFGFGNSQNNGQPSPCCRSFAVSGRIDRQNARL